MARWQGANGCGRGTRARKRLGQSPRFTIPNRRAGNGPPMKCLAYKPSPRKRIFFTKHERTAAPIFSRARLASGRKEKSQLFWQGPLGERGPRHLQRRNGSLSGCLGAASLPEEFWFFCSVLLGIFWQTGGIRVLRRLPFRVVAPDRWPSQLSGAHLHLGGRRLAFPARGPGGAVIVLPRKGAKSFVSPARLSRTGDSLFPGRPPPPGLPWTFKELGWARPPFLSCSRR